MITNDKGISLIFAVIFLLIVAALAAVLASLVSTDADIAFHEFRSNEAQYVAEGGIEYALKIGTLSTCTFVAGPLNLGSGSFTTTSQNYDCAVVSDDPLTSLSDVVNVTINAGPNCGETTDYLIPGTLRIENEYLFCKGTSPNSFTDCDRGVANTTASNHPQDSLITQCVVTSTGTVPTGIIGDAQRVVRVTVGQ